MYRFKHSLTLTRNNDNPVANGKIMLSKISWFMPHVTPADKDKMELYKIIERKEQEGHDGPVSLHWLIREIHSYQTLHYLGIGLKHKTPYKD